MRIRRILCILLLGIVLLCGCQQKLDGVEACAAAVERFHDAEAFCATYTDDSGAACELLYVDGSWIMQDQLPTGSTEWSMYTPDGSYMKFSNDQEQGDWAPVEVEAVPVQFMRLLDLSVDQESCKLLSQEDEGDNVRIVLTKDENIWYVFRLGETGELVSLTLMGATEDGVYREPEAFQTFSIVSMDESQLDAQFQEAYQEAKQ